MIYLLIHFLLDELTSDLSADNKPLCHFKLLVGWSPIIRLSRNRERKFRFRSIDYDYGSFKAKILQSTLLLSMPFQKIVLPAKWWIDGGML